MAYSKSRNLHIKVEGILSKISSLQEQDRYRGAFVFGSIARGEFKEGSDVDVKVLVQGEEHPELNHPSIDSVKLDISFSSIKTLTVATEEEIKSRKRIPMIAESIILFDKDNALAKLKKKAAKVKPTEIEPKESGLIEFLIYHDDLKIRKAIGSDPDIALLVMHTSLQDLLKAHYKKHGKWFVSNKRIFSDLADWDTDLASMLSDLVQTSNPQQKFSHWTRIVDHVLADFRGRKEVEETSCGCDICQQDLETLLRIE